MELLVKTLATHAVPHSACSKPHDLPDENVAIPLSASQGCKPERKTAVGEKVRGAVQKVDVSMFQTSRMAWLAAGVAELEEPKNGFFCRLRYDHYLAVSALFGLFLNASLMKFWA